MPESNIDPIVVTLASSVQNPFPQQGSWNMLDISNAAISGTLGVLSRYSASRVNPYVAIVGQTLCQMFELSNQGRSNIDHAVERLKVVGTMGKTLEVGFGIEDIVRVMAKTDEGRTCMGLCAALKECYSDDIAIAVLLEMAKSVKVEGSFMPSSTAWKELLDACAGILATSKFGVIAEHYMQGFATEHTLGAHNNQRMAVQGSRSCSNPKDIAASLFVLAAITKGNLKAATFCGGNDTGWLAAIAQFFFDLKLVIYDQQVGHSQSSAELFYKNCADESAAQVRIYYQYSDKPDFFPSLQLAGKTMVLGDVRKLFSSEQLRATSVVVSGRLDWKKCLDFVFTTEFRMLMNLRETLGTAFGSAAVLFKGLAQGNTFFPIQSHEACVSYCDSSYGGGFITNLLHWFPELLSLRQKMEASARLHIHKAKLAYEAAIATIRTTCGCISCVMESTGGETSTDEMKEEIILGPQSDSGSEHSAPEYDSNRFCLVLILETIIYLARILANVILDDEALLPTRSGLELAYLRQELVRRSFDDADGELSKQIGPIASCLDLDRGLTNEIIVENNNPSAVRMKTVLSLFSGREVQSSGNSLCAVSSNGITAYLGLLQELSTSKEDLCRIHIIPGKIIHDGKSYFHIQDALTGQDVESCLHKADGQFDYHSLVKVIKLEKPHNLSELIVDESFAGLTCKFDLSCARVGPARLARQLAERRGLVACASKWQRSRRNRCPNPSPFSGAAIETAIQSGACLDHNRKAIHILDCRGLDSPIPIIACTTDLPAANIFIVSSECLPCCIKQALSIDTTVNDFCFFIVPE